MSDEQIIQVEQEQAEQTIEVDSVQDEVDIGIRNETIDVTLNKDYEELDNKPSINGIELVGNKTSADLNITVDAYTKAQTDALLDEKANVSDIPVVPANVSAFTNDAGYLTSFTETDPVFCDSAAHGITSSDITNWNNKSDFSGSYTDLTDKPTIPTVPTNLSSFTDDLGSSPTHTHSQYLTEHQDISGKEDAFTVGDGLDMTSSVLSNPMSIEYIVGTQTEATNVWTGRTKDSTLKTGKIIAYYLPQAGTSSVAKLKLTLANGTETDAIELRRTATTTVTTQFAAGNVLILIYDGTYWKVSAYYDTNTNTIAYQVRTNSGTLPMTDIVYRYRLLFTSADNAHFVPANKSTSTNATAKRDTCQTPINPFGPIVYYGTTASVSAGSSPSAANLWQQYGITLGYSFNRTGAALVLQYPKPIYLKCAPQTDGSAIIDAESPYVQALPNTADGKIYIYLGIAYSATAIELRTEHPIYYHDGTRIRLYTDAVQYSSANGVTF